MVWNAIIYRLYVRWRLSGWFSLKLLAWSVNRIPQSAIFFFLIAYTYFTTTARHDGWGISLYEFSTVCVFWLAANCLLKDIISRQWFSRPFLPPISLTA